MHMLNPLPKQKGTMDVCLRSKDREQQWWQLMSSKGMVRLCILGVGEGNLEASDERCGSF